MISTIIKIGNSHGIILDEKVMEAFHLKVGDKINIEVLPDRTIVLTPLRKHPDGKDVASAIKSTMKDYQRSMRRLA